VLPHRTVEYGSVYSSSDSSLRIEQDASEACCDWSIADISFEGFGCAISQSGASMLTERVKGMTKAELLALLPSIMTELYGVEVGPQREKCAMLAFGTLKRAVGES
jgi:nitrogen fixation NifU-like protein